MSTKTFEDKLWRAVEPTLGPVLCRELVAAHQADLDAKMREARIDELHALVALSPGSVADNIVLKMAVDRIAALTTQEAKS